MNISLQCSTVTIMYVATCHICLGIYYSCRVTSSGLSNTLTCPATPAVEKSDSNFGSYKKKSFSEDRNNSDLKSKSSQLLPKTVLVSSEKDHGLDSRDAVHINSSTHNEESHKNKVSSPCKYSFIT